jgi:hypothetical protein
MVKIKSDTLKPNSGPMAEDRAAFLSFFLSFLSFFFTARMWAGIAQSV